MDQTLSCPSCSRPCRVDAADYGGEVACPHCGRPFRAEPGYPDHGIAELLPPQVGLTPFLLGLALVPWGVPMLWLAALVLSGVEPIFTFAVPVALAAGATGLGVGVGSASLWSHATRVKGLLALLAVSYALAGTLYFVKREWGEAARRIGRPVEWREFNREDRYTVRMPNAPEPTPSPLPGWALKAFRCTSEGFAAVDTYVVAHGRPPADAPPEAAAWFDRVRDALKEASGGQVLSEADVPSPADRDGYVARQYVLGLPDGATNRVVRVVRGRGQTFYFAAEGIFFTPEAEDVKKFFRSFKIVGK